MTKTVRTPAQPPRAARTAAPSTTTQRSAPPASAQPASTAYTPRSNVRPRSAAAQPAPAAPAVRAALDTLSAAVAAHPRDDMTDAPQLKAPLAKVKEFFKSKEVRASASASGVGLTELASLHRSVEGLQFSLRPGSASGNLNQGVKALLSNSLFERLKSGDVGTPRGAVTAAQVQEAARGLATLGPLSDIVAAKNGWSFRIPGVGKAEGQGVMYGDVLTSTCDRIDEAVVQAFEQARRSRLVTQHAKGTTEVSWSEQAKAFVPAKG